MTSFNTISKTALVAFMLLSLGGTAALADVKKGQKLYLKTLKSKLKMNGTQFSSLHTVAEWEALFDNEGEGFIKEFSEEYPKSSKVLHKPNIWKKLQHIRDFAIEYGSDSGNVPSCG